jgi:UDP-2-acetamido-2-deoxy-ribo-hexuluronate aminotransferase
MADLRARHARVADAVERGVLEVLRGGRYIGGPVVDEAERRLAQLFDRPHAVGVNSGTDALYYALVAAGVRPADRVVVPGVTFFATAESVLRTGATLLVADIREDVPVLGPVPDAEFVVAVHLFGEACLPETGAFIVDDAAQAAGADPPPRAGPVAGVSLYPSKTLGVAGDGGMVLADTEALAGAARRAANHGMPEPHVHDRVHGHVGGNSRLDAVQAAVLLAHLDDLPMRVARRREIARVYDVELPGALARVPRGAGHPVHHYNVRVDARDQLADHLRARGVETAVYYPRPVGAQAAVQGHFSTPNADGWCATALALPVHECLTDAEVEAVIAACRAFAA